MALEAHVVEHHVRGDGAHRRDAAARMAVRAGHVELADRASGSARSPGTAGSSPAAPAMRSPPCGRAVHEARVGRLELSRASDVRAQDRALVDVGRVLTAAWAAGPVARTPRRCPPSVRRRRASSRRTCPGSACACPSGARRRIEQVQQAHQRNGSLGGMPSAISAYDSIICGIESTMRWNGQALMSAPFLNCGGSLSARWTRQMLILPKREAVGPGSTKSALERARRRRARGTSAWARAPDTTARRARISAAILETEATARAVLDDELADRRAGEHGAAVRLDIARHGEFGSSWLPPCGMAWP